MKIQNPPFDLCSGCSEGNRRAKSKIANGFTLLEVVVAMAIVGLGVVTLLEIFSLGLRLEARGAARTEAVVHSRQVMDSLLLRRGVGDGREEGSLGAGIRWKAEVRPVRDQSGLSLGSGWELKEITLEMRYPDGGRERQLEVRTLRLIKKGS